MRWTDFHPLVVRHVQNTSMQCVRFGYRSRIVLFLCPSLLKAMLSAFPVGARTEEHVSLPLR